MVNNNKEKRCGSRWIKRVLSFCGALVVAALCFVPVMTPAEAYGQGVPDYYSYYDWDATIFAGNSKDAFEFNFPLLNAISATYVGEDILYYGNAFEQNESLVMLSNVALTAGLLSYDVWSYYPIQTVYFDWNGLGVYPNATDGESVPNCLPRFRFPTDVMVGFMIDYGVVSHSYIGAATEVGREVTWHQETFDFHVSANATWSPPVLAVDGEVLVRQMKIIVIPYSNSFADFSFETFVLDKNLLDQHNERIVSLIPYQAKVTEPGDLLNGDFESVDWTGWLTSAVGGFLDFEVIPGLSFEVILAGLFGVGLLIVVLEFFA